MFHKKKKKIDLFFIFFIAIVISIVLSVGILISIALMRFGGKDTSMSADLVNKFKTEEQNDFFVINRLEDNYKKGMSELSGKLSNKELSLADFLGLSEDGLLGIRVPKNRMESHLQTVLLIGKMQSGVEKLSDVEIKQKIMESINKLSL